MAWVDKYASVTGAGAHDGSSQADAWSITEAVTAIGTAASPTRVNSLAGTLSSGATSITLSCIGTAANPIWWRGYKTTAGDQSGSFAGVAGTDIPSLQFTTGGLVISGANQWFSHFDVQSASTTPGSISVTGAAVRLYHCRSSNTGSGGNGRALNSSAASLLAIACYFQGQSAAPCLNVGGNGALVAGNMILGGSTGIALGSTSAGLIFANILSTQGGDAITFSTGYGHVLYNVIYAPGGNGINVTGTPSLQVTVLGNLFDSANQASKAAINNTSGTASNLLAVIANGYYNCTANISGQGDIPTPFDVGTLASSGLASPASGDFSLTSAAKALGFPGAYETVTSGRAYFDLGAWQRQEPASGAGLFYGTSLDGGWNS